MGAPRSRLRRLNSKLRDSDVLRAVYRGIERMELKCKTVVWQAYSSTWWIIPSTISVSPEEWLSGEDWDNGDAAWYYKMLIARSYFTHHSSLLFGKIFFSLATRYFVAEWFITWGTESLDSITKCFRTLAVNKGRFIISILISLYFGNDGNFKILICLYLSKLLVTHANIVIPVVLSFIPFNCWEEKGVAWNSVINIDWSTGKPAVLVELVLKKFLSGIVNINRTLWNLNNASIWRQARYNKNRGKLMSTIHCPMINLLIHCSHEQSRVQKLVWAHAASMLESIM